MGNSDSAEAVKQTPPKLGGWCCAGALLKLAAVWNGDPRDSPIGLWGRTVPRLTAIAQSDHMAHWSYS